MSITDTIDALQVLHGGISGITSAPMHNAYPLSINTPDLPLVLTFPGPASHFLEGRGVVRSERFYVVRVFLAPVEQGELSAILPLGAQLLDAFRDLYLVPNGLDLDGDAIFVESEAGEVTDGGFRSDLIYAKVNYRGFDWRIKVTEKVEVVSLRAPSTAWTSASA